MYIYIYIYVAYASCIHMNIANPDLGTVWVLGYWKGCFFSKHGCLSRGTMGEAPLNFKVWMIHFGWCRHDISHQNAQIVCFGCCLRMKSCVDMFFLDTDLSACVGFNNIKLCAHHWLWSCLFKMTVVMIVKSTMIAFYRILFFYIA